MNDFVFPAILLIVMMTLNCGVDRLVLGSWWLRWRRNLLLTLASLVLGQLIVWLVEMR